MNADRELQVQPNRILGIGLKFWFQARSILHKFTGIAPLLSGQVIGSVADAFVIAEWRDAGGPAGPPRLIAPKHVHHRDD